MGGYDIHTQESSGVEWFLTIYRWLAQSMCHVATARCEWNGMNKMNVSNRSTRCFQIYVVYLPIQYLLKGIREDKEHALLQLCL